MITISERREHESAKSFVLRVLIDNIINTRLEPGEKLNEPELCEQLGVSRTPFREAELELAQRRLIEIRPKIGTYVSLIDAELVEEVRCAGSRDRPHGVRKADPGGYRPVVGERGALAHVH